MTYAGLQQRWSLLKPELFTSFTKFAYTHSLLGFSVTAFQLGQFRIKNGGGRVATFEVLSAVLLKIQVFLDVTPYRLADGY